MLNKETYWSRFVNQYEEKQRYVVGEDLITQTRQEMLKQQNLGEVLELGCGTGLYTETLQKISKKVIATDLSDKMIETARQKRGSLKNVEFKTADALNLSFDKERFDTVFMANLIHIIGDSEKVILESKRVLKKGGLLIITSFAINEMGFLSRLTMGFRYIKVFGKPSPEAVKEKTTKDRIVQLLANNDFEISKNIVFGQKSKAFYISCRKI